MKVCYSILTSNPKGDISGAFKCFEQSFVPRVGEPVSIKIPANEYEGEEEAHHYDFTVTKVTWLIQTNQVEVELNPDPYLVEGKWQEKDEENQVRHGYDDFCEDMISFVVKDDWKIIISEIPRNEMPAE